MAEKIINTTWQDELRFDSSIDASDITSGEALGNIERFPRENRFKYNERALSSFYAFIIKKNAPSEQKLKFVAPFIPYSEEEYFNVIAKQTFFKICEPENRTFYLGKVFTQDVSGAIVWNVTSKTQETISLSVSPEVVAESEANGWTDELEAAIELAKATYTTLKKIELLLEKDPEIPDRETLRFIFTVSGEPEQILEEESKFKKKLRDTIRKELREKITVTYYWK